MRKLVALAVVVILSSNVMASEGGINEETDLSNTDLESMQYSNIVYAEEEFSISMSLKNETTNISQINWITQVCINSGICYPPKTIQMSTEDNITWTASVLVDEDATYLNWRVDLVDENETIVKVPETGFGWKIWSYCWYDGKEWGGSDSSCVTEEESDSLPGFIVPMTISSIAIAALIIQRVGEKYEQ